MRQARALETECAHDAQALRHKLSGCHDYCRRRDAGARRTGPQRIRTVNVEFNDANDIDDICNQRAVSGAQWLWLLTDFPKGPGAVVPPGSRIDDRHRRHAIRGEGTAGAWPRHTGDRRRCASRSSRSGRGSRTLALGGYPFSSRTSSTMVSETRVACRQLRPIT